MGTNIEIPIEDDHNPDRLLERHGKSFHWARYFLGKEAAKKATRLYAFCRYLDDIADDTQYDNQDELLDIKNSLNSASNLDDKDPRIESFKKLHKIVNFNLSAVNDLIDGLITDQKDVCINNEELLIQYAYQVAGTVGLMMASILNAQSKRAFPFAIDLGIAMQLTNIARDVLEDAENHRRYIPGVFCNDMPPKEILAGAFDNDLLTREMIKSSINQILHIAEKYYDSGLLGLSYLPVRNHLAIGIAAIIYRQIGRKLLKKGTQWWTGRQVVGIFEKLIYSFLVIPALFNRLKTLPEHDPTLHIPLKRFLHVKSNHPQ